MTWWQGYKSGNDGLLKAIETAELLAKLKERRAILAMIQEELDNWNKTPAFNYRKEMLDLMDRILTRK